MASTPDPGFHLILRIDEPHLSGDLRDTLRALRPGGVHFGANAFLHGEPYERWLNAFAELRRGILAATGRERLVWALDHEGGRVHRLPAPIAHFPYSLNWGERAEEVGTAVGTGLRSLGINVVFGPCLDVFAEPNNAVIGPRAFGTTPDEVIRHALPYIRAVQSRGVAAVGKHFPGHGRTLLDSHFALPSLEDTLEDLLKQDLRPFAAAMAQGLEAIMSAHILYPKIDDRWPASLSSAFSDELVRKRMGFAGVVIADDFDMKAVADRYPLDVLAQRTLAAPADMVIFNHHYGRAQQWLTAMGRLVTAHDQAAQTLAQARARIEAWLDKLTHGAPWVLDGGTLDAHQALVDAIPVEHDIEVEEFTGD